MAAIGIPYENSYDLAVKLFQMTPMMGEYWMFRAFKGVMYQVGEAWAWVLSLVPSWAWPSPASLESAWLALGGSWAKVQWFIPVSEIIYAGFSLLAFVIICDMWRWIRKHVPKT